MRQLEGAMSKASGGDIGMDFSFLDSGSAVPWPELQEIMNHPPASRGSLGELRDSSLT